MKNYIGIGCYDRMTGDMYDNIFREAAVMGRALWGVDLAKGRDSTVVMWPRRAGKTTMMEILRKART